MFVLMSKKAAAAKTTPPPINSAAQLSSRTPNACDACRIRKAKCDGHTPCGRCRAKRIVCTSSRRSARVSGPVTEEHLAILQEQQRRLTRAISNMADIIKLAESRGFTDGGNIPTSPRGPELSASELADVLQRFAPESQVPETTSSPVDDAALPSKKRRLQENVPHKQQAEDIQMDDFTPTQTNTQAHDPFQKFLTTIQQHRGNGLNPTASSFQPAATGFEAQQQQVLPPNDPQSMSLAAPLGTSSTEFHPQLAPFVDMIDWDASLEHFLNNQYIGDSLDWSDWGMMNTGSGVQNGV